MQHRPMATLRFFSDDLSPDLVTQIVNKKPVAAASKGAAFSRRVGKQASKARTGTWLITTKSQHLGNRPERHLAWVVSLAQAHIRNIRSRMPHARADLSLIVHDNDFNLSDLPQDLLRHAVEIGELEIEVPAKGEDLFLTARNLASHLA
jgi:hypothetical protein